MCSQIHQFPSFLRRMSAKPHQIFAADDDQQRITISESEEREKENLQDKGDHEEIKSKDDDDDESDKATASHRDEVEDDDDGFKTPTSSDHKIPPITHCPPAPMKPRPPPPRLKRKASSPPQTSAEIESIFTSIAHDQDDPKMKKARTDNDDKDRS